jgi:hypothetical protein
VKEEQRPLSKGETSASQRNVPAAMPPGRFRSRLICIGAARSLRLMSLDFEKPLPACPMLVMSNAIVHSAACGMVERIRPSSLVPSWIETLPSEMCLLSLSRVKRGENPRPF